MDTPGRHRQCDPWPALLVGALVSLMGGTARLAAQNPMPPPTPTSSGLADPPAAPAAATAVDTTAAAAPARHRTADADSVDVYKRFTLAEYGARVFRRRALLGDVAFSGLTQMAKRPSEWPRTWEGYGNRASLRLGTRAISQAVTLGVAAARDERPADFSRCRCAGTGPRLRHAVLTPYQMNTPNGKHSSLLAPAVELASSILVTSMRPGGFSVRDGLVRGAFSLSLSSAGSVVREFWPWRRRPLGL